MPDFVILPNADYVADPDDWTNATIAFGVTSPATVTGLTNSTAYVALEIIRGTASSSFTPVSAGGNVTATVVSHQDVAEVSATPTFDDVDLSAFGPGDKILVVYGTDEGNSVSAELGGVSMGASFEDTRTGNSGARMWAFEHELTGAGSATTTIGITTDVARNAHKLAVIVIEGGTRDDSDSFYRYSAGGSLAETVVNPSNAQNAIVAFSMGRDSAFGAHSWTGATQSGAVVSGSGTSSAIGLAEDVAVGAYSVDFQADPAFTTPDEFSLLTVSYSA